MNCADLHFHTTHSDGRSTVEEVVRLLSEARKAGLGLAVLTDHDGVQGFADYAEATRGFWKPICASELSCGFFDPTEKRERELHLLVYGLDPQDKELQRIFSQFRESRKERILRICDALNRDGIAIDAHSLVAAHGGTLGRPHIADRLIEMGVVATRSEAFDKYLHDGSPYCVKKWRLPLEDAVRRAKAMGAKTSAAHPGQYGFREAVLERFKEIGVDAIEVIHPRHTQDDRNFYEAAAKRYGFKMTGGSDFHVTSVDQRDGIPTLGRTEYPLSWARDFLGDLL